MFLQGNSVTDAERSCTDAESATTRGVVLSKGVVRKKRTPLLGSPAASLRAGGKALIVRDQSPSAAKHARILSPSESGTRWIARLQLAHLRARARNPERGVSEDLAVRKLARDRGQASSRYSSKEI